MMEDEEDDMTEEEKDPTESYWWREEDEQQLASEFQSMVDDHQNFTRTSTYFNWCRRVWLFYYKMAFGDNASDYYDLGVSFMGDEGELVAAQINHFRNLLKHRVNLVTKDRPSLICRARNTDLESQTQTDFGNNIIDYYMKEKDVEARLVRCAEHAALFGEGFLVMTWDPNLGDDDDADEETGEISHKGDLRFENVTTWNVIRDWRVRDNNHNWLGTRRPVNKWDLAAEYPEHAKKILAADEWIDIPLEEGQRPLDEERYWMDSDQIEVMEFWHKRSSALPQGRYILICNGEVLQDLAWDYDEVPIKRLVAGEMALSPYPYTEAFDLVTIQELLNNCISTIATNQNAWGVQSIWMKSGSMLRISEILGGMNLIESDEEPTAVQLTATPNEVYTFADSLVKHGEQIAGIDEVTRGYASPNVRAGNFAALLQTQSLQFSSELVRGYHKLLEGIGTGIIRLIRQFATTERVLTIVGKHNKPYTKSYLGSDLELIDRVNVETVDPMFNSYAGKMDWAQLIAGTGLIHTPEEMLNVFRTGNPDSLLEADKAQLNIMREENELLLEGQEVPDAIPEDNQILHLREHAASLGSIEVRNNPEIRGAVQAHMMSHINLLLGDNNTQMMQTMLGYESPIPPGAAQDGTGMPVAAPMGNQPQPGGPPQPTAQKPPSDQPPQPNQI
jgi:hypothetical protein